VPQTHTLFGPPSQPEPSWGFSSQLHTFSSWSVRMKRPVPSSPHCGPLEFLICHYLTGPRTVFCLTPQAKRTTAWFTMLSLSHESSVMTPAL